MTTAARGALATKIALSVADGLRGAALNREAKRVEVSAYEKRGPQELVDLLTIIERTPGISADVHRLVAIAKKLLAGDQALAEEFDELVAYLNGMGPAPGHKERS